jgi:putative endonuclease
MVPIRRYSVYILESLKGHQHYVGLSANVERRVKKHNAGKVRSTKSRRPCHLIFQEFIGSLQEARKRKKHFKSAAGRKYLEKLLSKRTNDC